MLEVFQSRNSIGLTGVAENLYYSHFYFRAIQSALAASVVNYHLSLVPILMTLPKRLMANYSKAIGCVATLQHLKFLMPILWSNVIGPFSPRSKLEVNDFITTLK